jgi:hypothetical protein
LTYGNVPDRWFSATDGRIPDGTAVPATSDSIASGALSARGSAVADSKAERCRRADLVRQDVGQQLAGDRLAIALGIAHRPARGHDGGDLAGEMPPSAARS